MRILIIEDEQEISAFLKRALEREEFAVDVAADGESGFRLARLNPYEAIVLDNILPHKPGIEVCRDLRAAGTTTPIIILSVKTATTQKIELLNAGADDYLTKPFSFEELLARIKALLRRPHQIEGDILTFDDLVVDTTRHTVSRGGEPIALTRKESMLLTELLRRQGAVLSAGMLYDRVWNNDYDPFSNTIESHIWSLRRKLERPGKPRLLHTVSGRGYKIDREP